MNISILKNIENERIKNNLTSFSVDRAINRKKSGKRLEQRATCTRTDAVFCHFLVDNWCLHYCGAVVNQPWVSGL